MIIPIVSNNDPNAEIIIMICEETFYWVLQETTPNLKRECFSRPLRGWQKTIPLVAALAKARVVIELNYFINSHCVPAIK